MFESLTIEREEAKLTEDRLIHEMLHPPVEAPPRKTPRLVRWLEWLVVVAFLASAVAASVFMLRDTSDAEIRADLFGTRYREAGVAAPSVDLPWQQQMITTGVPVGIPDVAEATHLTSLADLYVAQTSVDLPWQSQMITTAVPIPVAELAAAPWQAQMISTAVPLPGAVYVPQSVYASAAPTLVPSVATAVVELTAAQEAYLMRSIAPAAPTASQQALITPGPDHLGTLAGDIAGGAIPGPYPDHGEGLEPVAGRFGGPL